MATIQPTTLSFVQGGNVYVLRGLTAQEVTKLTNAITSHQDISGKLDVSLKGANNGLAELDSSGKVPSSQLPSYVDDVVEYDSISEFPAEGESGKIYIDKNANLVYRWSGSTYVAVGGSGGGGGGLVLGETSSTAYRGDRGKYAYDHAMAAGSAFNSGLYKITTNNEGHVTSAIAVSKSDITALGIPASDTTYQAKPAAENGSELSLVTTGEKYNWNARISASDLATALSPIESALGDKLDADDLATALGDYVSQTALATALASYITQSDLATALSPIQTAINGKLAANQGSGNAGKILAVGNNGDVSPVAGSTFVTEANVKAALETTEYTVKFLREDGNWANIPTMTGASASTDGYTGLVPVPLAGSEDYYLAGDGTWKIIPGAAVAAVVSKEANGLCPMLPDEDTTTKFLRQDGTWAVPPDTNTTYALATSAAAGLVKIGYTTSGKNYAVQLSNGQMYVNVPWSNTNTWRGYQVKSYEYTYTNLEADTQINLKANDFGVSTPSGYTPVGILEFWSGNTGAYVTRVIGGATGSNTMMSLRNKLSSKISSATASIKILYLQTG